MHRVAQSRTRKADTPEPDLQASMRLLRRRLAAAGTWQGSSDCPVTSRRPTRPPEPALPSPDSRSLLPVVLQTQRSGTAGKQTAAWSHS